MDQELKQIWHPEDEKGVDARFAPLKSFYVPPFVLDEDRKRATLWLPLAVTASVLFGLVYVPSFFTKQSDGVVEISLSRDELEELYLPLNDNPLYLGVNDE